MDWEHFIESERFGELYCKKYGKTSISCSCIFLVNCTFNYNYIKCNCNRGNYYIIKYRYDSSVTV